MRHSGPHLCGFCHSRPKANRPSFGESAATLGHECASPWPEARGPQDHDAPLTMEVTPPLVARPRHSGSHPIPSRPAAAHRGRELDELAQDLPGVARIDDLLDPEGLEIG